MSLGLEGGGSYCLYGSLGWLRADRVSRAIFIDPKHLHEPFGEFIIAHEAMHAYVTPSAFDRHINTALRQVCNPEELNQEIGFPSTLNFLEDCGGNSWLIRNYPAFRESGQQLYDSMLNQENPKMGNPEIKAIAARLGFYPRFAQFGSEIMKRWHTGSYSKTLDPEVEKVLRAQQNNADRYIAAFPEAAISAEQERDALYCKRYIITANAIMPDIRKLVSEDKAQAAQQQFLNNQISNNSSNPTQAEQQQDGQQQDGQQQSGGQQGGGQQSGEQQGGQQQSGQQQGGSSQTSQSGGADSQLRPSPSASSRSESGGAGAGSYMRDMLTPNSQNEINRKTAAHREALRNDLKRQLDNLENHLGGTEQDREGQEADPNSKPTHEDLAKQIAQIKNKINEKFSDAPDKNAKKDLEKHLEILEKLNKSIDSQATPLDSLSEQTQRELKELYDGQPVQDKRRFEQAGAEILKDLEDALRELLEGRTTEKPAPTHRQIRDAIEGAKKAAQAYKEAEESAKRLEEIRREQLSLWDAAREEVASLIGTLYSRLERVLRPTVPEWEGGHSTGNRINPQAAMQAAADSQLAANMWERRSLPTEREFVFSLLVDNSGSMQDSGKYLHARRCAVLLSEVLTRLRIPFEITIFSDSSKVLRTYTEKPNKEKKNLIGSAINGKGGGTNDYEAVEQRVASLCLRPEENKFLIVITDGGSNDSGKLEDTLEDGLNKGIRVIGLGLGNQTSDVDRFYPIGKGGLTLDAKDEEESLGSYFAKLLEGVLSNPHRFVAKALMEKSKQKKSE